MGMWLREKAHGMTKGAYCESRARVAQVYASHTIDLNGYGEVGKARDKSVERDRA